MPIKYALLFVFLFIGSGHTYATSIGRCVGVGIMFDGFVNKGIDDTPLKLPSNAKGVLYESHYERLSDHTFSILDETSSKALPVKVTKLKSLGGIYFWVSPKYGFRQGKTYVITHKEHKRSLRVQIDGPLRSDGPPYFSINLEGQDKTLLRDPWAIAFPAIAQPISYSVPAAYEPYRNDMLFFTEVFHKESKDGNESGDYELWQYVPEYCKFVGAGRSYFGPGKELLYSSCSPSKHEDITQQVRGRVGFLELEDKLYETAVVNVEYKHSTEECSELSIVQSAVDSQDNDRLAKEVCTYVDMHWFSPKGDVVDYFSKLSTRTDPKVQQCIKRYIDTYKFLQEIDQ